MNIALIVIIVLSSLFILWFFFYLFPVGLWFTAQLEGISISFWELTLMNLRKIPIKLIVASLVKLKNVDLNIKINQLESLFISGGSIGNVVKGMILAKEKNITLGFDDACAIDRKGYSVIKVIEEKTKE